MIDQEEKAIEELLLTYIKMYEKSINRLKDAELLLNEYYNENDLADLFYKEYQQKYMSEDSDG